MATKFVGFVGIYVAVSQLKTKGDIGSFAFELIAKLELLKFFLQPILQITKG